MAGGNPVSTDKPAQNPLRPASTTRTAPRVGMKSSEPEPGPEPASSGAVPADVAGKITQAGGQVPGVPRTASSTWAGAPAGGGMPGVKARVVTGSHPAPRNPTPNRGKR